MAAASPARAAVAVRVIFLGPPGAGKGTQAVTLAAHMGVPRISTGDMLRTAIANGTSLGRHAQPAMGRGNLVPDELLLELVGERIAESDCADGFVLDGFPRTLPQAQGLERMTTSEPRSWVVFDFQVPRGELMQRLSGRRSCPSCQAIYHLRNRPPRRPGLCDGDATPLLEREDDKESVVAERLREYEERTQPLVDYYRGRARLVPIDGNRSRQAVFQDLLQALEVRA